MSCTGRPQIDVLSRGELHGTQAGNLSGDAVLAQVWSTLVSCAVPATLVPENVLHVHCTPARSTVASVVWTRALVAAKTMYPNVRSRHGCCVVVVVSAAAPSAFQGEHLAEHLAEHSIAKPQSWVVAAAFAWSSSTIELSASVVVSPMLRPSATSRSSRRMILPERVFGRSGVM